MQSLDAIQSRMQSQFPFVAAGALGYALQTHSGAGTGTATAPSGCPLTHSCGQCIHQQGGSRGRTPDWACGRTVSRSAGRTPGREPRYSP